MDKGFDTIEAIKQEATGFVVNAYLAQLGLPPNAGPSDMAAIAVAANLDASPGAGDLVKAITGPLPSFSEKSEREMIAAGNRRDRIKESIYNYYITRRGLREKFINRINEIIDSLGASPCDYTSSEKETKLYNIFVRNYLKSVKIENEVGHGIENAESYLN